MEHQKSNWVKVAGSVRDNGRQHLKGESRVAGLKRKELGWPWQCRRRPSPMHMGHVRLNNRGPLWPCSLVKVFCSPSAGYFRWTL